MQREKRRKEGRISGGRQAGSSESAEQYSNTLTPVLTIITTAAVSTDPTIITWTWASDTGLSILNAVSNFSFRLLRNKN